MPTRSPAASDFSVDVEGVGSVTFGRRTIRDRLRIAADYNRFTGGADSVSSDFGFLCEAIATLGVLIVEAPAALLDLLSLENFDPIDDGEGDKRIASAFLALRQKELSFRSGQVEKGKEAREGDRA